MFRFLSELLWFNSFSDIPKQNFTLKMNNFGFFQIIKIYTETTLLLDRTTISQGLSYKAQQNSRRFKSPKIWPNCLKFVFQQNFGFNMVKVTFKHCQKIPGER